MSNQVGVNKVRSASSHPLAVSISAPSFQTAFPHYSPERELGAHGRNKKSSFHRLGSPKTRGSRALGTRARGPPPYRYIVSSGAKVGSRAAEFAYCSHVGGPRGSLRLISDSSGDSPPRSFVHT